MEISEKVKIEARKKLDDTVPELLKAGFHIPEMFGLNDGASPFESKSNGRMSRMATNSGDMSGGMGQVARTPLMYADIMLDPLLLFFPKDRLDEVNKRFRRIYETHPIVNNILDLHSTYPLSDFYLQCDDPEVEKYYNDFKDRVDLLNLMRQMLLEFYMLGETNVLGNWDVNNFEWSEFVQYPPENIEVYGSYASNINLCFLKPDADLQKKLKDKSIESKLAEGWDKDFVESVRSGKPYHLRNERLIRLVRNPTRYTKRGISILWCVLHDVLMELKLRILQMTAADRWMFPLKMFKLGSKELG